MRKMGWGRKESKMGEIGRKGKKKTLSVRGHGGASVRKTLAHCKP